MSDERLFDDRRRVLEEEYFRKKDHELLDRLRLQEREANERGVVSQALGLTDEGLLKELQAAGFGSDTIVLLYLLPVLKVAWAEGTLQTGEGTFIKQAAEYRGVQEGSAAATMLDGWLKAPPPPEVYDVGLRALRASIGALRGEAGASTRQRVLDLCTRAAEAGGGLMGFGAISARERNVLDQLMGQLTPKQQEAAKSVLEGD